MARSKSPRDPAAPPPSAGPTSDPLPGPAIEAMSPAEKGELLAAIALRLADMKAWVRREIALTAAGVSEAERREMNP